MIIDVVGVFSPSTQPTFQFSSLQHSLHGKKVVIDTFNPLHFALIFRATPPLIFVLPPHRNIYTHTPLPSSIVMAAFTASFTHSGRGGYNAPLTNAGRGGYNGPNTRPDDEDDDRSLTLLNFGRRGYNAPLNYGPDDDEEEDGRGGYN